MHLRSILLSLALGAPPHVIVGQASAPYHDPRVPVDDRVCDLLGRLTLQEKFWQLYMTPGDLSDSTHDYSHGAFGLQITSVALRGTPADLARADALHIDSIQRFFVERTRLGIPIVPFDEAVHGLVRSGATVFPQAIALAATWDTVVVGHVADAIAAEAATRGIHQVLSPVLNLARDARWGRVEETYGEDPLLASAMGRAFIGPFEARGIAATPKHMGCSASTATSLRSRQAPASPKWTNSPRRRAPPRTCSPSGPSIFQRSAPAGRRRTPARWRWRSGPHPRGPSGQSLLRR